MEAQLIPLEGLDTTAADRVRYYRDAKKIDDYAAALEEGAVFPPINVYEDEAGKRHAWDGGYRIAAHRKQKAAMILALVEPGDFAKALAAARLANAEHGYARSIEDKQKIARELVIEELDRRAADPAYKELSGRELGRQAKLSHTLLNEVLKAVKAERAKAARDAQQAAADKALVVEHLQALWDQGYRSLPSEWGARSIGAEELGNPGAVSQYRLGTLAESIRLLLDRDERTHPRRHDVFKLADGSVVVVLSSGYQIGYRRLCAGGVIEAGRVPHNASPYEKGSWREVLGDKGTYTIVQLATAQLPDASKWVPAPDTYDWIDGDPELGGPPLVELLPEGWTAWSAPEDTTAAPLDRSAAEEPEEADEEDSEQDAPLPGQQLLGGGEVPRHAPSSPVTPPARETDAERAAGQAQGAWIGRVVARLRMMSEDERQAVEAQLWPETAPEPSAAPVAVQLPTTRALLLHMVELLDADDEDLARRRLAAHPRVDLHRQGSTISMDRPLDADQIRAALAEVLAVYDPPIDASVDLTIGAELIETDAEELAATEATTAEVGLHEETACGTAPTWGEQVKAESAAMVAPEEASAEDLQHQPDPVPAIQMYQPWTRSWAELLAHLAALPELELRMVAIWMDIPESEMDRAAVEEQVARKTTIEKSARDKLVAQYIAMSDTDFKALYKQHKGVSPSYRQTRQRGAELLADAVMGAASDLAQRW